MDLKFYATLFLSGMVIGQAGEPISGGAGWVGAGMLGSVLAWLLFVHLPSKDKQIKEMIESRDSLVKELADTHRKAVADVVDHCRDELSKKDEYYSRHHTEQMGWLQKIYDTGRETTHAVRNMHSAMAARTQLADAFQSAEVAAWTKRLDGVITGWNTAAERLLGWRQGEIVGRSVYKTIVPPELHGEERDILGRIGRGETLEEYVSQRTSRSGAKVKLVLLISPVRDQTGQVIGASTIAREAD